MSDKDPKKTAKPDTICTSCFAVNRPCSCRTEFVLLFMILYLLTALFVVGSLVSLGIWQLTHG